MEGVRDLGSSERAVRGESRTARDESVSASEQRTGEREKLTVSRLRCARVLTGILRDAAKRKEEAEVNPRELCCPRIREDGSLEYSVLSVTLRCN